MFLSPVQGGIFFSQLQLDIMVLNFTKSQCGVDHACGVCRHFREVLSRALLTFVAGCPSWKITLKSEDVDKLTLFL